MKKDNRSKFKCELCGKEYNYNSSLKKHLKTHHNVVSPSSSSVPKYEGFNENFGNMEMSTENFAPQTNYALELDPIPELYQTSNEEFFNTNNNNKIEDFNGQNYENYYLDPKSLKENELAPELETVKSFQIYHGGHVDLLENCNLTHVNENGKILPKILLYE